MSGWNTDNKESARCFIEDCAHSKEASKIKITIQPEVWKVIVALTKEIKVEWQAFLTGTELNGEVVVSGYWIPKQKVGAATVENLDCINRDVVMARGIVASIHSHADMAVFHSGTDMESTCKSAWIKHHITVNNKLEYVVKSQYSLPCGKIAFIKAEVVLAGQEAPVLIEGLANIEKQTYVYDGTQHWEAWRKKDVTHRDYDDDYAYQGGRRVERQLALDYKSKPRVHPLHRFNRYHRNHVVGNGVSYV